MALSKIMYKTRPGQTAFLGVHSLITTHHTLPNLWDMSKDKIFQSVFSFGIEQIHDTVFSSEGNTAGLRRPQHSLISHPVMRDSGLGWHQLADALGTQTGLNRYS